MRNYSLGIRFVFTFPNFSSETKNVFVMVLTNFFLSVIETRWDCVHGLVNGRVSVAFSGSTFFTVLLSIFGTWAWLIFLYSPTAILGTMHKTLVPYSPEISSVLEELWLNRHVLLDTIRNDRRKLQMHSTLMFLSIVHIAPCRFPFFHLALALSIKQWVGVIHVQSWSYLNYIMCLL